MQRERERESRGPFFWQVEKDNKSFHILGTIHIGVSLAELQCSNTISNVLNASNEIWTEHNLQTEVEHNSQAESDSTEQDKHNQASLTSSSEQQEIDQPGDSSPVGIFSVKKENQEIDSLQEALNNLKQQYQQTIEQENQEIDSLQEALNNLKQQYQQTIEQENQEMLQLIQSATMDDSGQSFQNLSEESKSILANIINSNNLEDEIKPENLSYLGLTSSINQICSQNLSDSIEQQNLESENPISLIRLDLEIQQLAQEKEISQYYLDDSWRLNNMLLRQALKNIDLFSKKTTEKVIKDCSEEKRAENQKVTSNTLIKFIGDYKDGKPFIDYGLEKDIQNFRQAGATEDFIADYVDFFNNEILKTRNENWVEKLFSAYDNQIENIFVAAGLGHFEGSVSVLSMLEKQGFTIKRMRADCTFE